MKIEEIKKVERIKYSEESSDHQQPEENLEQDYNLNVDDIPQDQQLEEDLEQDFYEYDYNLDADNISLEMLDDKPDNPPNSDLNIPEQLSDTSDLGSILTLASYFF